MTTELVRVSFHDDTLEAMKDDGGKVWVNLRRCCEALGVDPARQIKKLSEKPWACVDQKSMQVAGDDQKRVYTLIDLDTLSGWLFSIDARKIKPEHRDKLVRYQRESARVLADHFFPRAASPAPARPAPAGPADPLVLAGEAIVALRREQLAQAGRLRAAEGKAHHAQQTADFALRLAAAAQRARASGGGWYTIPAYCRLIGRHVSFLTVRAHASRIDQVMAHCGMARQTAVDPQFGPVGLYPEAVLAEHFDTVPAAAG